MSWLIDAYRSNVTKKAVMAITGVMLFGFVLVHMFGNLKLYLGPESLNHYAEWLREIGEPALPHGMALNIARAGLLGAVVLHIWSAWAVTQANRKARPTSYVKPDTVQSIYAARTMRWGGVIIFLYVIYHLLHLTYGTVHPDFIPGDVYHNVVTGFQVWWVAAVYLLANLALGFHLYHGLWSLFQSLGWNHPSYAGVRRHLALAFALIVTLGNLSFPISVLAGLVTV